jgi:hypothetical protein
MKKLRLSMNGNKSCEPASPTPEATMGKLLMLSNSGTLAVKLKFSANPSRAAR